MPAHRARWFMVPAIAVVSLLAARPASAQSISFGLMAGASLSTFTGDFSADVANSGTFIAGGFVRLAAVGFAVQPGLFYTGKGAQSSDYDAATGTGSKTNLNYIQIPIVIRIRIGPIYVGAGPALGIKLSCTNAAAGEASSDCTSDQGAKSTEISGIAEAGLAFGKFSVGARGDFGLTNAFEAIQTGNVNSVTAKTRTLSAVAAIRF